MAVGTDDGRSFGQMGLVIQEYDFHIVYRKGQHNNSADALSWKAHRSLDVTAASVALQAAMRTSGKASKMIPSSKRSARPF